MSDTKCWMMITSDEFYKNGVDNLPEGKWGCIIEPNHHQFSSTFDALYKNSLEFSNRENLVFALVSVGDESLAHLLNSWSFGNSGLKIYLIVHEILHPWKEK